jgi:uncharacterized protein YbaP (TraB family)
MHHGASTARRGALRRGACALLVLCLTPALAWPQARSGAAARPATRGLIWTVERDGKTSWLVGSLHLLPPDAYPLPATVEAAFQSAETLIEEADPDELRTPDTAAELLKRAFFPPGQTLQSSVADTTFRVIVERATKAGLPVDAIQRMRPWMAAVTLAALEMQSAGFDPSLGIDRHFRDRAIAAKKPVRTLEAALEQITMLEALGPALQDAIVIEALQGASSEVAQVKTLLSAWQAGDAAAMERLLVDSTRDSPQIHQALFIDRNKRWVPKIEACLAAGRCMVIVGSGHLVGTDGLVDLLSRRGYRLTQR